jgi:hypothetical protein
MGVRAAVLFVSHPGRVERDVFRYLVLSAVLLAAGHASAGADPVNLGSGGSVCTQIAALMDESVALKLPPRVERALTLTLQAADAAVHDGQNGRARTLLRTFAFEVRGATRAKRLQDDAAQVLIAGAQEAIGTLSRGGNTETEKRRAKNE